MNAYFVLVGGGLANSLIAYRLLSRSPDTCLLLIERGSSLGGNHTWSFHAQDLTADQHAWLAAFVEYAWPHYEVRFPQLSRRIDSSYFSFSSARLHHVIVEALGERVIPNAEVEALSPTEVVLRDGRRFQARTVIDGRGDPRSRQLVLRYQKFLGQVVVLKNRHGLDGPIIMDATVAQREGYRFLYTLPYSDKVALIEDTRYSDSPALERDELRIEIRRYAELQGWHVQRVEREEEGILPVVLSGNIDAFWNEAVPNVARSGLRAALFHPTTGYSLPEAVRLADDLSDYLPCNGPELSRHIRKRSIGSWRRNGFYRMLNRMLFLAGEPDRRYRVLERFYSLPEPLIGRFYAGRSTHSDQLRMLSGAPPVPVRRALRAIFETGAIDVTPAAAAGRGPRGRA